jgi:integrase
MEQEIKQQPLTPRNGAEDSNLEQNQEGRRPRKIRLIPERTCNRALPRQGGVCMSGTIYFREDRGIFVVSWYDKATQKKHSIYRYNGEFMYHQKLADKCLATIQSDYEKYMRGEGAFRIEKYTGKGWTDVIEYFQEWLEIKRSKKPATYKGYRSFLNNWIKPFFEKHPVMLHEIKLDTLYALLDFVKLSPKGKYNVMNCFHAFMVFAWRSERIPEVPPFPEKSEYGLVQPVIKWLPEERQMRIINAIPEEHRPIFLWLKYHLRRPSEACALRKEDYDPFNDVFIIRRTLSARQLVESTKTNTIHVIPCHSEFNPIAKQLLKTPGHFLFQNPRGTRKGGRYSVESMNLLWRKACQAAGESIDMYSGLKHSSCCQYLNDKGLSISELQIITDHANMESVKRYGKIEIDRKRQLLETRKTGPKLVRTEKSQ